MGLPRMVGLYRARWAVIGVGILLDTFLVRTLTVPAMAALVGEKNWWPSRSRPAAPAHSPAPAPAAAAARPESVGAATDADTPGPTDARRDRMVAASVATSVAVVSGVALVAARAYGRRRRR